MLKIGQKIGGKIASTIFKNTDDVAEAILKNTDEAAEAFLKNTDEIADALPTTQKSGKEIADKVMPDAKTADEVIKETPKVCKPNCFVAGTMVLTSDGLK